MPTSPLPQEPSGDKSPVRLGFSLDKVPTKTSDDDDDDLQDSGYISAQQETPAPSRKYGPAYQDTQSSPDILDFSLGQVKSLSEIHVSQPLFGSRKRAVSPPSLRSDEEYGGKATKRKRLAMSKATACSAREPNDPNDHEVSNPAQPAAPTTALSTIPRKPARIRDSFTEPLPLQRSRKQHNPSERTATTLPPLASKTKTKRATDHAKQTTTIRAAPPQPTASAVPEATTIDQPDSDIDELAMSCKKKTAPRPIACTTAASKATTTTYSCIRASLAGSLGLSSHREIGFGDGDDSADELGG
ncbi:hypothetical protein MBLNU459_g3642t1 [Dothideomycetes sp. NU459]